MSLVWTGIEDRIERCRQSARKSNDASGVVVTSRGDRIAVAGLVGFLLVLASIFEVS